MCDPSCYVCGHAPEEHRGGYAECEYDGDDNGCAAECIYFKERECEEKTCDNCGGDIDGCSGSNCKKN